MAVGIQPSRLDVDNTAGNIARDVKSLLSRASAMATWLDSKTDQELQVPPYSYSQTEVTTLRAAFDDLQLIVGVFTGQAALPVAKDFRADLSKLWGIA